MKVTVIGGTGLIGSQVVARLTAAGHQAVPAALSTGLDLITGQGLDQALDGAEVVVNVANSPAFDESSLDFFRPSRTNCPSWCTTGPSPCRRTCCARGLRRTPSCAPPNSSNS